MRETFQEALREPVLAGRFLGSEAAASRLAHLTSSADPALTLGLWFGAEALLALRANPDPVGWLRAALDRDIAALDAKLSRQLDAVLSHPRLVKLEGSWRGLGWLVQHTPQTGSRVKLKVLSARWSEVCRDLERAVEFDQSHLFKKVHEEQFGMAGGEPFGLLACDYEVRHRPSRDNPTDDVAAVQSLASIAAASFAPTLLGASPELLGLDSFAEMTPSFDPASALQSSEHLRWRQSLAREDLRFVAVALPRVLGRAPWADDSSRVDRFRYRSCPPRAAGRVWTSAVYGFAAVAVRAFDRYSWPAEVRGADIAADPGGGVLEDLPFERFASDLPFEAPARAPLELALTDEQENQLGEAGLVALAALEGLSEACFGSLPSLHKPPRQRTDIADANQRISAQFNTLLCVSRFAHCVKMMGRDMIGSFMDPADVEKRLQDWLNGYVSGGILSAETTAKYPLLDAKVEVRERRGQAGVFNCTVHLRPQHQLDDVGASFRLVTEFAPQQPNA
jgi:type VI secretion system protein ImpD/type VI secretion system protein ImpC